MSPVSGGGVVQPGRCAHPGTGPVDRHACAESSANAVAAATTCLARSSRIAVSGVSSSRNGLAPMNQARATCSVSCGAICTHRGDGSAKWISRRAGEAVTVREEFELRDVRTRVDR